MEHEALMSHQPFWSFSIEEALRQTNSQKEGLSSQEAHGRLQKKIKSHFRSIKWVKGLLLFLSQFKSPLILLLIAAAGAAFFLGDKVDALIIMIIVSVSALLGFFQEFGAINSLEQLLQHVESKANVLRDGQWVEVPFHEVVSGDIVQLVAGNRIPGDCLLLESNHLFIDESMLTGESAPGEKKEGISEAGAPQAERKNGLFMGTNVLSGKGLALVFAVGKDTIFGEMEERTKFKPPQTAFEQGVQRFGFFLMVLTGLFVSIIFGVNLLLHRPLLESLLFSLAIAVGLIPQLLPAIISVNLSHGARKMAKKKVIVKRLAAIENFGLMNILCTDKTGTITEGKLQFERAVDPLGGDSEKCHLFGYLNAHFQSTYPNPLDQCITAETMDVGGWEKIDEIPYDFDRRRLSVRLQREGSSLLITKGAVDEMLSICSQIEWKGGDREELSPQRREEIERYFAEASKGGFRTIAIGYSEGTEEKNLCLLGFFHFQDPIKKDIGKVVVALQAKGIQLKIITGDHYVVALYVAEHLGLTGEHLIRGSELGDAKEEQLLSLIRNKNIFAEIEPHQKENIILSLRKSGNVVGFLGDGINDISALHSADVSISVNQGADSAKEASDFVLLSKNLSVLLAGVEEGRHTFANTIKYVYMAVSANFGNMFSMAGASLFLPFLPLLPKQVLLTNLLTDIPEMAIASDLVDIDLIDRPVKWDLKFICKFMIVFGLISSIFDYLTFGCLLFWMKASEAEFRTGWFIESVASAAIVALLIRTRHYFFSSRPGTTLTIAVGIVVIATSFLPLTPLGTILGFAPLPLQFYGAVFVIVMSYLIVVEIAKRIFFRKKKERHGPHLS